MVSLTIHHWAIYYDICLSWERKAIMKITKGTNKRDSHCSKGVALKDLVLYNEICLHGIQFLWALL